MSEMYSVVADKNYLKHHGIIGQKHGVRNGPPYPLRLEDLSSKERKALPPPLKKKKMEDESGSSNASRVRNPKGNPFKSEREKMEEELYGDKKTEKDYVDADFTVNSEQRTGGVRGEKWEKKESSDSDESSGAKFTGSKKVNKAKENFKKAQEKASGKFAKKATEEKYEDEEVDENGNTKKIHIDALTKAGKSGGTGLNSAADIATRLGNIKRINSRPQKLDLRGISDEEMQKAINRINLEQRYTEAITPKADTSGYEVASEILKITGDIVVGSANIANMVLTLKGLKDD